MATLSIQPYEPRLCEVDGEVGYFHTWEQFYDVIPPSLLRGGHSGGLVGNVFGIVEFKDRVEKVMPYRIKFCDETNACLSDFNEMKRMQEGGGIAVIDVAMVSLIVILLSMWLLAIVWTLSPFRPFKRLCHDILDFDGCSFHAKCRFCGRDIMQDSQGNWFTF